MTGAACHYHTGEPTGKPPFEKLYIYYITGRAGGGPFPFGTDFIGNWEEEDCSFLFFSAAADEAVRRFIDRRPNLAIADIFHMPYEEWQAMDMFPLTAGGFCIHPPWTRPCSAGSAVNIVLDPGVVFGTGAHATTRDCLEALTMLWDTSEYEPASAIDIGTGTGLLAVAAALSGVKRIIGIDINFLAARTAKKNVRLNHVEDTVMIVKGSAKELAHLRADLLIANIHYEVMRHLINGDAFLSCKYFILSGLLATPARQVLNQLDRLPVKIIKIWNNNQIWCTILGKIVTGHRRHDVTNKTGL